MMPPTLFFTVTYSYLQSIVEWHPWEFFEKLAMNKIEWAVWFHSSKNLRPHKDKLVDFDSQSGTKPQLTYGEIGVLNIHWIL
jgi:hypothetical protein